MNNKILIIGNGFDLYHKLPTSYKDFLFFSDHWKEFKEEYDKHTESTSARAEEKIHVRLGEGNELTADSLKDFAAHACLYDRDHIDYLDEHLEENAWLTFFDRISPPGFSWVDFESEIHEALNQVEIYYSELLPNIKDDVPMNHMMDFMKNVISIFGDRTEKTVSGFKNLANSVFRSSDMDVGKLRIHKMVLLETMKNELDALNLCLNYYLLEFVSRIKCSVYSEQIKEIGKIFLLNFNYTNTYVSVYGDKALLQHHPIHGEAREENLVLGISDEAFKDSIDYVYFQKFFQRIQKRTGNYYKKWPGKEKNSEFSYMPTHIYIMGHSLDKVDKGILKDFFFEDNVEKIIIFYHTQSGYESKVINLVEMFGRDYIIEQTGEGRIVFEKLKLPVALTR